MQEDLGEIQEWTNLGLLARQLFNPAEGHQWAGSQEETEVQSNAGQILPLAALSSYIEEAFLRMLLARNYKKL